MKVPKDARAVADLSEHLAKVPISINDPSLLRVLWMLLYHVARIADALEQEFGRAL